MTDTPKPRPTLLYLSVLLRQSKKIHQNHNLARKVCRAVYSIVGLPIDDFIFQICPSEVYAMARFNQSTFSSLKLTRDQERDFQQWVTKNEITALSCLEQLTAVGFKISCSWVVDSNAFCFSIIGTDATKQHRNMVMTTWSDDLEEVICMGAYKHFVICDGEAWPEANSGERWG